MYVISESGSGACCSCSDSFLPFNMPYNFLLKAGRVVSSSRYRGNQHFSVRFKALHDVLGKRN